VAASLRLQLGHPGGQGVDQIEQSDDEGVQRGVLGSLVLGQHPGGEGVELIDHRLRVLRQRHLTEFTSHVN
jgi:hypothetical protein